MELIREENLKKIEEHIRCIGRLAVGCGLSNDDLIAMFRILNEEEPNA